MSAEPSFHFRVTDDASPAAYIGNIISSTMFKAGDEIHLSQFSTNTSIPRGVKVLIVKDVQPAYEGTEKRAGHFTVVAEWKRG
jgi:hypothetical protein